MILLLIEKQKNNNDFHVLILIFIVLVIKTFIVFCFNSIFVILSLKIDGYLIAELKVLLFLFLE